MSCLNIVSALTTALASRSLMCVKGLSHFEPVALTALFSLTIIAPHPSRLASVKMWMVWVAVRSGTLEGEEEREMKSFPLVKIDGGRCRSAEKGSKPLLHLLNILRARLSERRSI